MAYPDVNFYNAMSQNRSCNYYLESSFNDLINKSKEKSSFSLWHINTRSIKKNIKYQKFWIIFGSPWSWLHSGWIDGNKANWMRLWFVQTPWLFYCRKSQGVSGRRWCICILFWYWICICWNRERSNWIQQICCQWDYLQTTWSWHW